MGKPKHTPKRDANEPEVVSALQAAGCSVQRLDGKDIPDLLVGFRHRNYLVEVKNAEGRNRVEEGQKQWALRWQGDPPYIVRNLDDVATMLDRWAKR